MKKDVVSSIIDKAIKVCDSKNVVELFPIYILQFAIDLANYIQLSFLVIIMHFIINVSFLLIRVNIIVRRHGNSAPLNKNTVSVYYS